MTNNRNVPIDYLVKNIVQLVLGLRSYTLTYSDDPKKIEKFENLQELTGIYKGDDGTFIKITEKKSSLYREMYRRKPIRLIPKKDGLFYYKTTRNLKINFENIGKKNQVTDVC